MVEFLDTHHTLIIWLASGLIYQIYLEFSYDHKFYSPGLFEYVFSLLLGPINYLLALGHFFFNKFD